MSQTSWSSVGALRNAFINSGGWGISVLLAVISTPVMVVKMTAEGYGVYALLTGLVGYYGLLDLGLGQGVMKFVAEYRAVGNSEAVTRSINAALMVQIVVGAVATVCIIAGANQILHILKISSNLLPDAKFGLIISALAFFVTMLSGTYNSVLGGLQRFDISAKINVSMNIMLTLLTVAVLLIGFRLKTVIILNAGAAAISFVLTFRSVCQVIPTYRLKLGIDLEFFSRIFNFSGYVFLSSLSSFINNYFLRFIVGYFLGPIAVTYYVVPLKIINAFGGLLSSAAGVLFPLASAMKAEGQQQRMTELMQKASKGFAALAIPFFLSLFVFARPVMTVWMGTNFAHAGTDVLSLLALACMVGSLTTVPNQVLIGLGYSRERFVISLVFVVFNLLMLPVATKFGGVAGAVVAILVGNVVSFSILLFLMKKLLGLHVKTYLTTIGKFHLLPICLAFVLRVVVSESGLPNEVLLVCSVVLVALYFCTMVYSKWLSIDPVLCLLKKQSA